MKVDRTRYPKIYTNVIRACVNLGLVDPKTGDESKLYAHPFCSSEGGAGGAAAYATGARPLVMDPLTCKENSIPLLERIY